MQTARSARSGTSLRPLLLAALGLGGFAVAGCEQPNPLLQGEPIGEMPRWGQEFQKDHAAGSEGSLLLEGGEGAAPTGPDGIKQTGGSAVPAANPMAGEKWGGGDPNKGKSVFVNQCALCHGDRGQGGNMMGMEVPTLRDPEWHDKVDDNYIGLTVAHGKGGKMPAFIGKLKKADIDGVIAFVRTLKQKDEEGGW